MTKEDLRVEYKNIPNDKFTPSVNYPDIIEYNLNGEIRNVETKKIL